MAGKLSAAVLAGAFALGPAAYAMDRPDSLAASFQGFCTPEPPPFAQIDQKASSLHLPVIDDIGRSQSSGQFLHSKSWAVTLPDGPHDLVAVEGNGPDGFVTSCAISANDPEGAALKAALVRKLGLTQAASESLSKDGARKITQWAWGKGGTLTLVDATPQSKPGAMIVLMVRGPARP